LTPGCRPTRPSSRSWLYTFTAAETNGAARIGTEHPDQRGGRRDREQHRERVQPEVRPQGERLERVLDDAVGEQHDQQHHQRGAEAVGPVCDQHRERAGDEGTEIGDVAGDERHHGDGEGERDAHRPRTGPDDDRVGHAEQGQPPVDTSSAPGGT
jgi:hypothetical protein